MNPAACILVLLLSLGAPSWAVEDDNLQRPIHHGKRHRRRHKVHGRQATMKNALLAISNGTSATQEQVARTDGSVQILDTLKGLEQQLSVEESKEHSGASKDVRGSIKVNGPLPPYFRKEFSDAVAQATGDAPDEVTILNMVPEADDTVVDVTFTAPKGLVTAVQEQAADPSSRLATGALHDFLVAPSDEAQQPAQAMHCVCSAGPPPPSCPPCSLSATSASMILPPSGVYLPAAAPAPSPAAVFSDSPISMAAPAPAPFLDVDTQMPYGTLEPFGREDTAQELTEQSIKESDAMVDQLEKAEVAEEKRAVFRALTRLRGAAISSFDGIASSQTGNIDHYAKSNKWREVHPVHHLANEEADVSTWAFPSSSD